MPKLNYAAETEVPDGTPTKKALGFQLTRARKSVGLTQAELSKRSGIPQPAISRIENGTANPTFETLASLSEGMGLKLDVSFSK